jgi:hypothetical protein
LIALCIRRADACRFRPAPDIFAIRFAPYFCRPMYAASAGLMPPRVIFLNLAPVPSFALATVISPSSF